LFLYFITVHVAISIYLKPTHAQLKHSLKHNAKNIKMSVSFLPYMFRSRDWPSSGAQRSTLSFLLAICCIFAQPYSGLWPAFLFTLPFVPLHCSPSCVLSCVRLPFK
jgi:hypothetical protein